MLAERWPGTVARNGKQSWRNGGPERWPGMVARNSGPEWKAELAERWPGMVARNGDLCGCSGSQALVPVDAGGTVARNVGPKWWPGTVARNGEQCG